MNLRRCCKTMTWKSIQLYIGIVYKSPSPTHPHCKVTSAGNISNLSFLWPSSLLMNFPKLTMSWAERDLSSNCLLSYLIIDGKRQNSVFFFSHLGTSAWGASVILSGSQKVPGGRIYISKNSPDIAKQFLIIRTNTPCNYFFAFSRLFVCETACKKI